MANTKFDSFLDKHAPPPNDAPVDWDACREEWVERLNRLFATISDYLSPYAEGGKIRLTRNKKEISEEYIGRYNAPTLGISIGLAQVQLVPVARYIIGAGGRVDMIGPSGIIRLLVLPKDAKTINVVVQQVLPGQPRSEPPKLPPYAEWEWKIASAPPKIRFTQLDKDSFFSALMECVGE